jgi:hypothetical protein
MKSLHKSILIFVASVALTVPIFLRLNSNSKKDENIKAYRQSNLPANPLKPSLPKVVHFNDAATLQLIAYSGANKLTTGTWKSIWGTMTSDGLYSFPDQIPPAGFDSITFTDNSGKETTINLAFDLNHPEDFESHQDTVTPEVHLSRSKVMDQFSQNTTLTSSSALHLHAPLNRKHLNPAKPILISSQQIDSQKLILLSTDSSIHSIYTHATQVFSVSEQPVCTLAPNQITELTNLKQNSNVTVSSPLYYRKLSTPILQTFTHKFSGGQLTGNYFQVDAVAIQYQDHYKLISGKLSFIGSTVTQTRGHYGFGFTPTKLGVTPTQEALGYNLKGYKFNHNSKSISSQLQL